ncbi:hypothetical protein BD779DRAFT_582987 [Infundibulicybe gibba]|nr:hypothetical protein BD779DRAFT_582987 [Infundibulicybe gibba]
MHPRVFDIISLAAWLLLPIHKCTIYFPTVLSYSYRDSDGSIGQIGYRHRLLSIGCENEGSASVCVGVKFERPTHYTPCGSSPHYQPAREAQAFLQHAPPDHVSTLLGDGKQGTHSKSPRIYLRGRHHCY